jgi:hypothetical protein
MTLQWRDVKINRGDLGTMQCCGETPDHDELHIVFDEDFKYPFGEELRHPWPQPRP